MNKFNKQRAGIFRRQMIVRHIHLNFTLKILLTQLILRRRFITNNTFQIFIFIIQ